MKSKISIRRYLTIFLVSLFASNYLISVGIDYAYSLHFSNTNDDLSSANFTSYIGDNCTKLGEYDTNYGYYCEDFTIGQHVTGDLAFVESDGSIIILDLSEPNSPEYLTSISTLSFDSKLFALDNILYVCDGFGRALIVDYSNPSNPEELFNGYLDGPSGFLQIFVQDDILYGLSQSSGLYLIDVSDKTSPELVSQFHNESNSFYYSFIIHNKIAYISHRYYLSTVDLTDQENPTIINTFTNNRIYSIKAIAVANNLVYITTSAGQIAIVDYTNDTNPQLVSFYMDSGKYFRKITVIDDLALAIDQATGIHTFDISDSQNIRLVSHVYNAGRYTSMEISNDNLYLFDIAEGIEKYSLENIRQPEFIWRFYFNGESSDIAISGDLALIANGRSGLEIYKLRNNNEPKFMSRILSGFSCQFVEIGPNNLAYVHMYYGGIVYVVDYSDPKDPQLLRVESLLHDIESIINRQPRSAQFYDEIAIMSYSRYHILFDDEFLAFYDTTNESSLEFVELVEFPFFKQFEYHNEHIYIVDENHDLRIYSYEPQNTVEVSFIELNTTIVTNLHLAGNLLFAMTYFDVLIFNIADPSSPVFVTRLSDHVQDVTFDYLEAKLDSNILYAMAPNEVHFYNFRDVDSPYLEGSFKCNETLNNLAIKDGKVYLAASEINLEIIQLDRLIVNRLLNILAPISSIAIFGGITVTSVLYLRRRKKQRIAEELAKEEQAELEALETIDPDEIDIDVVREEFDSEEVYEYALEVFEDDE